MAKLVKPIARLFSVAFIAICITVTFGQSRSSTLINEPQSHKKLKWTGSSGGCVVNIVNTPCRTIRSHSFSFGFDGIGSSETIEAFDYDGSVSRTYTVARWRGWHLPEPKTKLSFIVLRTENRRLDIDHDQSVFHEYRGGENVKMPYWEEDDSACSHTKSHFLYLSDDRLPDAVVAGVHVVGYGGQDHNGADYEVYFAPSLGCQEMRFQMSMRSFLGWKKAQYEMVVDSFELGAPARRLFMVPSGYTWVDSINPR